MHICNCDQPVISCGSDGCICVGCGGLDDTYLNYPISMTDWDLRFIRLAEHIAGWSRDPSTKVGAVITEGKRVVSLGFNGFPQGVADDARLDDRAVKYEMVVHAEINAILFAKRDLTGCTLYTWPMPPCSRCASVIIQSGITRVVAPEPAERWKESCNLGKKMFEEAGVKQVTWRRPRRTGGRSSRDES